jgi:hypothetical protein
MPRFHYTGAEAWKEMLRPIGPVPYTCAKLGCHQYARRGSIYCVWCDPKATEEEKRAATLALESPLHRRRWGRWSR